MAYTCTNPLRMLHMVLRVNVQLMVLRVNVQLECGTKSFSNWKASLLCRASRGFLNRKYLGLINFENNNFSAAM